MYWTAVKIRSLRRRLALTENQLAQLLGYSDGRTIAAFERGSFKPSADVCDLLDRLEARAASRED